MEKEDATAVSYLTKSELSLCSWESFFLKALSVGECTVITPGSMITHWHMKKHHMLHFSTSSIVWIDQLIWSLNLGPFPFSKPYLILSPSLGWWGQFLVGGRLFLRQQNMGVCSPLRGPTLVLIRWAHPLRTIIYNLGTLNNVERLQGTVEMAPS